MGDLPGKDDEIEALEELEADEADADPDAAPAITDYGLHDASWETAEWRGLLDELIDLGLVTWKEVVVLALGQMNPPQVGTAVASSPGGGFRSNFDSSSGESLMSAVMRWFYSEAGTCADCGSRLDLQADHIEPREKYDDPSEADRLDNLTLRCRRCNVIRRPSHVFGGLTHLSAEAALMWILLVVRPRNLIDFVRLCRLYGMTMADVRMQEAWAMAMWLSRDERVGYQIDHSDDTYVIELWQDGAITRRSDSDARSPAEVLYKQVHGEAVVAFVTLDDEGAYRLHEIPVAQLPFSTYDLGARPPSALAVIPTPPDRASGVMTPLRSLPPRGLELVGSTVRAPNQTARVKYLDGKGAQRVSDGPASRGGRIVRPAPASAIAVITI